MWAGFLPFLLFLVIGFWIKNWLWISLLPARHVCRADRQLTLFFLGLVWWGRFSRVATAVRGARWQLHILNGWQHRQNWKVVTKMVSTTLKKLALNHEAYYYTNLRFTPGCIASFKNSSTAAKLSILLTNVAWFETKVLMNGPNDKQSCSGSMIGPID